MPPAASVRDDESSEVQVAIPEWPTLRLILPASATDVSEGLLGAETTPVERTQALPFDDGRPHVLVTCTGLTKDDLDETLFVILRRLEQLQAAPKGVPPTAADDNPGGQHGLRIVVHMPRDAAVILLHNNGQRLKDMCRRCMSPVRVTIHAQAAEADPLLVFDGAPEAFLTALPDLTQVLRERDKEVLERARQAAEQARVRAAAEAKAKAEMERANAEAAEKARVKAASDAKIKAEQEAARSNAEAKRRRAEQPPLSAQPPTNAPDAPESNSVLLRWLKSLDGGRGSLLVYGEKLNELFDDLDELELVASGPNGEVPDPQFFEDLECTRQDHRDIFRVWFKKKFRPC